MAPPLDLVEPLPAGKRGYRMQVVVAETYAAVGFVLIKMNQRMFHSIDSNVYAGIFRGKKKDVSLLL